MLSTDAVLSLLLMSPPPQSKLCSCPPSRGMEREWKKGRGEKSDRRGEGWVRRDGGKRKEERDGIVEEGGEGREGRMKRYNYTEGTVKEWECRRVEVRGDEKLTRKCVPTCLFTQMLSTDAVPSLLLISLPSPHSPSPHL